MNIKVGLLALSLTAFGTTAVTAQSNNAATATCITKAQFQTKISAYQIANGAQSDALLEDLITQMRVCIGNLKASITASPNTATENKMNTRIQLHNEVVQKSRANNKTEAIQALNSFAATM